MNLLRQVWKRHSGTRPAIFLDRDGTLIEHQNVISDTSQLRIFQGVPEALKRLQEAGFLLIMITNQPNIEKGLNSREEVMVQHEHLRSCLEKEYVQLDAAYACPHKYPSTCTCRKPEQGMILAAEEDFDIDMKNSWFIGDTGRDMETGKRALLRTVYVATGDSTDTTFDTKGEFEAKDLRDAAQVISGTISP